MQAVITGLNGTVAPCVAAALTAAGHGFRRWDRGRTAIDDPAGIKEFLEEVPTDSFFHLATGSPRWAELAAGICADEEIRFLFTSSVSVFADRRRGPFSPSDEPDATDAYGRYKIECERLVRAANPESLIVRLGWQIADEAGSNNMVDFLETAMRESGHIEASSNWYPSCCHLQDTASALVEMAENGSPGLYHLEGNPGKSFYEIVTALNRKLKTGWVVIETPDPDWDNRLLDPRLPIRSIERHLSGTE